MTAEEIVSSYKEAKDKQAQLTILVDLAQMPRSQIVGILRRAGLPVKWSGIDLAPITFSGRDYEDSPSPPKRLTQEERQKICELLKDGASIYKTAQIMGTTWGTVKKIAIQEGIKKGWQAWKD